MSQTPGLPRNRPDTVSFMGVSTLGDTGPGVFAETAVSAALIEAAGLPSYDHLPHQGITISEKNRISHLAALGETGIGCSIKVHELVSNGFVLELNTGTLNENLPLHFADFDDTCIATSQARARVQEDYGNLLSSKGIILPESTISEILEAANGFSRWEEDGQMVHHIDAHLLSLSWATNTIVQLRGFAAGDVANHVTDVLKNMTPLDKGGRKLGGPDFGREGNRLVSSQTSELVTPDMVKIFMRFIRPEPFEETIELYRRAQHEKNANTGIFTYGVPAQQLIKVLTHLIHEKEIHAEKAWLPQLIFLTKVPKGNFLQAFADRAQGSSDLGDLSLKVFSCPKITLLDDDPHHLDSIVEGKLGVTGIRSIRPGTKTTEKMPDWLGNVVDFRQDLEQTRRRLGAFLLGNA
ncbi:MAG: hypothetical protein WAQ24_05615 [Candidatus Saccharimonadales bacterium]